jgi:hypothetical protein
MRPFSDYRPGEVVPGEGIRGQPKQSLLRAPDQAVVADAPVVAPDLMAARLAWIGNVSLTSLRVFGGGLIALGPADVIILTAVAVLGWVALAIWGRQLRFSSGVEAARFLRRLLTDGDSYIGATESPPFVPPPPVVRLPGFTAGDHEPFQVPGLTPAAPAERLPGFTPRPEWEAKPADAGPVTIRPTTVEHAGREGDPLRSRSSRARRNASHADPEVTGHLTGPEWEAHHQINLAGIERYRDLIAAAGHAGWKTDDGGNVVPLPANKAAQEKLRERGIARPLHDSGHPEWNNDVTEQLELIRRRYQSQNLNDKAVGKQIRQDLEKLQHDLGKSLAGKHRITQADGTPYEG